MSVKKFNVDVPRGWIRGENQPLWHEKAYKMWWSMWHRVDYCDYYKDVDIWEGFIVFSNFLDWLMREPRFQEFCDTCMDISWSIDKDMKDINNRHYYPKYMTLCTLEENRREMLNRSINPNLKKYKPVLGINIDNKRILLFKYTREVKRLGFDGGHVIKCINKKQTQHKGYKWFRVNYNHNLRLRFKEVQY